MQSIDTDQSKPLARNTLTAAGGGLHLDSMALHLINHMPLGVVVFDRELKITDSNPTASGMLAGGSDIAQTLTVGSEPNWSGNWHRELTQALGSGEPCTFENISYSNNDRNYILHIICTPLTDSQSGELIGGILLIEDITAKMMMEHDLAAAERLAAVGKLAARVAHELNNPLDGILRYINLALRVIDQNRADQATNYLQESRKGLTRMVRIISELLEFSRSTFTAFEEADINKIVEDAAKAMETLAAKNKVAIIRRYCPDMPNIQSGNLFQVFCNLVKNGIDAMSDGGELELTTRCDSHMAIIEVADTGAGISEDVRKNLFEPFFTTKANGQGTGLGLAICKEIIDKYNGKISVQNRKTQGCTFTVSIPLEQTNRKQG